MPESGTSEMLSSPAMTAHPILQQGCTRCPASDNTRLTPALQRVRGHPCMCYSSLRSISREETWSYQRGQILSLSWELAPWASALGENGSTGQLLSCLGTFTVCSLAYSSTCSLKCSSASSACSSALGRPIDAHPKTNMISHLQIHIQTHILLLSSILQHWIHNLPIPQHTTYNTWT